MRNAEEMTPKQAAQYEMLASIRADYHGHTDALWRRAEMTSGNRSAAFAREMRRHLAKTHNALLSKLQASYDGEICLNELDENPIAYEL